jgi:hypothetical protein
MLGWQLLIIYITLALAAAFLFIWKRRDTGGEPVAAVEQASGEPASN